MQIAIVNCEVSTNHYQEVVSLFSFGEIICQIFRLIPPHQASFIEKFHFQLLKGWDYVCKICRFKCLSSPYNFWQLIHAECIYIV